MDELGSLLEGAHMDSESLTLLLVAGSDRSEVLRVLGADAESDGWSYPVVDDDENSGYAAIDVEGGVVAFEHTGYADPTRRLHRDDAYREIFASGYFRILSAKYTEGYGRDHVA